LHEFRTDKWVETYAKRFDEMVAAAKSRNVPVFWVGLPPIRGTRGTADVTFLNDFFRSRAEKAGVVYVDVWDGFVDEAGNYTNHGPDFEGQNRRLRAGDGVHFTRAGARKLAHYVEREIRRAMLTRNTPIAAIPKTEDEPELRKPTGPAARPIAGPVVPLTTVINPSDTLAGDRPIRANTTGDNVVTRVLVRGEPVAPPAGRADDFAWPRRDIETLTTALPPDPVAPPPAAATPAAPAVAAPAVVRPAPQAAVRPRPPRPAAPRPLGPSQWAPQPFFWPFGR
jgi:hypothetical protein